MTTVNLARNLGKIVQRVVQRFGQPATLLARVPGTFSTAADTAAVTEVTYAVQVVVSEYQETERPNIRTGDKRILVAVPDTLDRIPTTSWRITVETRTYEIIAVRSYRAQAGDVLYELQARGA